MSVMKRSEPEPLVEPTVADSSCRTELSMDTGSDVAMKSKVNATIVNVIGRRFLLRLDVCESEMLLGRRRN